MKKTVLMLVAAATMSFAYAGVVSAAPLGSFARQHNFGSAGKRAPLQFQLFCLENPSECKASGASKVSYTPKIKRLLSSVNSAVNRQIRPRNEKKDVWKISATEGDCDDYVMTKRHRLIRAGVPSSALRVAVVKTRSGEGHAVLVVKTTSGEYVLDNLRKSIVKRQESGYRYLSVSSANPMRWNR